MLQRRVGTDRIQPSTDFLIWRSGRVGHLSWPPIRVALTDVNIHLRKLCCKGRLTLMTQLDQ